MMKSSAFKSPMGNGSPLPPLEFLSEILALTPPTPNVTVARISVIMGSPAPCIPVLTAGNRHPVMPHIIVWKPNVISVTSGDILMKDATFGSVEDAMPRDMWSITVQSTHLPNQRLTTLMEAPTRTTMTSTPWWMTTRKVVHVKPGARIYEGGNVTISFLSHVFFLILVV